MPRTRPARPRLHLKAAQQQLRTVIRTARANITSQAELQQAVERLQAESTKAWAVLEASFSGDGESRRVAARRATEAHEELDAASQRLADAQRREQEHRSTSLLPLLEQQAVVADLLRVLMVQVNGCSP